MINELTQLMIMIHEHAQHAVGIVMVTTSAATKMVKQCQTAP